MTKKRDILVNYTNASEEILTRGNKFVADLSKALIRLLKSEPQIVEVSDKNTSNKESRAACCLLWLHENTMISDNLIQELKDFERVYLIFGEEQVKATGLEQYTGYLLNNEQSDTYWINIVNLAYDIFNYLMPANSRNIKVNDNQKCIYFTKIANVDLVYKNLIESELKHFGFSEVLDVNGQNTKINAAITILPERETSENEIGLLREQLKDINAASIGKHFVWVKGVTSLMDSKLFNLFKIEGLLNEAEVVNAPVEIFKSLLIKRLTEEQNQIKIDKTSSETVYLIHDIKDNVADKINDALKSQGKQVVSSKEVINAANPVKEHRNILVNSEAVVIHYPNSNNYWLLSKLNDLMKTPGYGKTKPFKNKFLICSENVQLKESDIMGGIDMIKYHNEITGNELDILLNKLQ